MKINKNSLRIRLFLRNFKFINIDKNLLNFIDEEFKDINEKYKNYKNSNIQVNSNKVWVFWWQGKEDMPEIVRICIDSIKRNTINAEVIFLDKNNFSQYINLPSHIIDKLNNRSITLTHFSDILRMSLLAKHGGLWADATCFIPNKLDIASLPSPFYSIHLPDSLIQRGWLGKWTGFYLKTAPGNIIPSYACEIFYEYWKKYSCLPDYFFIDYVIYYGYLHFSDFKQFIDANPINNSEVFTLMKKFNHRYEENKYQSLLNSSSVFKLSYKFTFWRCRKKTIFGRKTIYGKFVEDYNQR